jgi:hypothetical protein
MILIIAIDDDGESEIHRWTPPPREVVDLGDTDVDRILNSLAWGETERLS